MSRGASSALAIGLNLLAVVVAIFLATEWFIARKSKTTLIYEHNPRFRHELRPHQTYARDGFSYVIGAHGLRGSSPELPKPDRRVRVAVMGGSSVFDHRVDPSWPERVERLLRARGQGDVEVFNAGVPGFSTREVLPFFAERVRRFEPDVVALYAGWNDLEYMKASRRQLNLPSYPSLQRGGRDAYAWLTAPRPLRNWYALPVLWSKIRSRTGFVEENTAVAPPPRTTGTSTTPAPTWSESAGVAYWRHNLEAFVDRVRRSGAVPVLIAEATLYEADLAPALRRRIAYDYVRLDHSALVELTELMHATAREVASLRGVDFIDPRPELNGRPELFFDHVHLTEAGSRRLAEAVAPRLEAVIDRRRAEALEPRPGAGQGSDR